MIHFKLFDFQKIKRRLILQFLFVASISTTFVISTVVLFVNLRPDELRLLLIVGSIGSVVFSYITASVIAAKNANRIKLLHSSLQALSLGNVPTKLTLTGQDEIAESAAAINNIIERLETAATFAGKIGNGELTIAYDERYKNDALATSLQRMHVQLKETAAEQAKRTWTTTGLAKFGETLRSDNGDLRAFGDEIISHIVRYLKANQGQLYILSEEDGNECLELISTYAWNRKKHFDKKVTKGEGLIGQAWMEQATIYLKEIPQGYIKITSGLGESLPANVVIVPLMINETIYGMLELASFSIFQKHEIEFLEKLAELIASSLSAVKVNERTRRLLAESQSQTEELRAQEEEMRQNMEELTATQEEMSRKDIEISGQLTAINNSMATIEFDMQGNVLNANDRFLNFTGYTLNGIRGKHHRFFCDDNYANSLPYDEFWRKLRKGIAQSGEFKRQVKNGRRVWISASYTVVTNREGAPVKVMKFALDITEQKMRSLDFEGQVNAINATMAAIEFTLDGKIVSANDNFISTMNYSRDEIIGKHHSMFMDSNEKESDAYRKFWSNLREGQAQSGEFKRIDKEGKHVWLHATYTPIKDSDGIVFKVIKFAQNITNEKLRAVDFEGQISAVNNTMAMIEFSMEGTIINANSNFVKAVDYSLSEIIGKHHSMFIDSTQKNSAAYQSFWNDLRNGKHQTGEFKRFGKNNKEIWISASYTPILDPTGKVYKVIKFAQDITQQKMKSVDHEGQINAIRKSTAVVEFDLHGSIIFANPLFVEAMGYRDVSEIVNAHHSIFVPEFERESEEYKQFWKRLQSGEYFSGEFQRKKADGKSVWIFGSYNPILNPEGQPYKVVKYASVVANKSQGVTRELVTAP